MCIKVVILTLSVSTFFSNVISQTFHNFISELDATPMLERQAKVDSFMQTVLYFPVTEDTMAHFVYQGTGQDVAVPGDFNGWDPNNGPLTLVEGTDFWYRTENFYIDARLDYKYFYDGNTWILDPLNPYTCPGGFGDNSELRMPDYVPPEETTYYPDIPHGSFEDTTFYSIHLDNSRQIRVYLPPGYNETTEHYPVVIVHDGLEYINLAKMHNVMDYLISENRIDPIIAVFIPPVDRNGEYTGIQNEPFSAFIVDEILSWMDGKYLTLQLSADRAVIGSSAGGNISLWLGMNYPEVFGNVGAFSSYVESDIQSYFENNPKLDVRIYMNHGIYDHLEVIQTSVHNFVPVLEQKGYDYQYAEYPEGHSYGLWRAHLDDVLEMFFPKSESPVKQHHIKSEKIQLNQNYPNPFNPETTIHYQLLSQADVSIFIYNINGNEIKTFFKTHQGPGLHSLHWNGTDQEGSPVVSGQYLCKIVTESADEKAVAVHKMILVH